MSAVIKRLRRRHYPIDIDGETVFARSMKRPEREACEAFKDEESSLGFVLGVALVSENGLPLFQQTESESAKEFGERVLADLDLPDDTRSQIINAILKLSTGPTADQLAALKKN